MGCRRTEHSALLVNEINNECCGFILEESVAALARRLIPLFQLWQEASSLLQASRDGKSNLLLFFSVKLI